ncbi:MAG: DUF6807 family protein [Pirellulaceae bacterium]
MKNRIQAYCNWQSCCCVILFVALQFHVSTALHAGHQASGKRQLSWRETPGALALMNGDRVVWQFNHLQDGSEKGCPYFHPLATMEDAVLTDLRPDDHLWRRSMTTEKCKLNCFLVHDSFVAPSSFEKGMKQPGPRRDRALFSDWTKMATSLVSREKGSFPCAIKTDICGSPILTEPRRPTFLFEK